MVALDLLGRRTSLRLLWELRGEPMTFRALENACQTNSRLLNTRLSELREVGIVEHAGDGYQLTDQGKKLVEALRPLSIWAEQWGKQKADD